MKAAVTVEIGGASYRLDEDAFLALRAYLERAAQRLGDHPDRAEVLAGLERSISAKLASKAGARSMPFDGAEMGAALKEVGKVDGPQLGASHDERVSAAVSRRSRRLYRLCEGRKIAGVCAGLAAFADLDVNLVRAILVVLALFSGGAVLLGYLVLTFLVPIARTPSEIAAAHGTLSSAYPSNR